MKLKGCFLSIVDPEFSQGGSEIFSENLQM